MRVLINSLVILLLLIPSAAQTTTTGAPKPRVFISDSQSWEMSGNAGGANGTFAAHSAGGARPQTAEIVKTFGERCPDVIVNNKPDKADYVVLLDHEGGKGLIKRDNKMAVFNKDGDSIVSHSTRSLGNSVKDACDAIMADWPARAAKNAAAELRQLQPSSVADSSMRGLPSKGFQSRPLPQRRYRSGRKLCGQHSVRNRSNSRRAFRCRQENGLQNWERKLKVTGGSVNVSAELEKLP